MFFKGLLDHRPLAIDLGLFLIRVCAGCFLLTHGISKLTNFSEVVTNFADPFGLGSWISLALTIFAEVFCSAFLVLGALTRVALVPLIILMFVIVFDIHGAAPFGRKELPLFYLITFISLFFTGPGRFSIDGFRK